MKKRSQTRRAKPAPASALSPDLPAPADSHFHFQLYTTGTTPRSTQAVANLRSLCEEHLDGRYNLEVIDLYQEPGRAAHGRIIASPTLVKILPGPVMRMVGSLANREQLMIKLDISTPLHR